MTLHHSAVYDKEFCDTIFYGLPRLSGPKMMPTYCYPQAEKQ